MNCIIVEDEFPAREELKYYLKNTELNLIREFSTGEKALEYLHSNKVDVVFLDINMPGLDGMTLAKVLANFQNPPKIIFITAYKEFAIDAFEINAHDYLLKPYDEKRIKTCIERLFKDDESKDKNSISCNINRLSLWCGEKMLVKSYKDILLVEACERECKFYINNNSILIAKMPISKVEDILPKDIFFKNHRSYIVNINFINEIIPWSNSTYMLRVGNVDKDIPVSRNRIKEFKNLMHMN